MIQIKNLNKSFELYNQNNTNINVFKNINFKVNKGEVVALTGNSGTGKSTLLKLIFHGKATATATVAFLRKSRTGWRSAAVRMYPSIDRWVGGRRSPSSHVGFSSDFHLLFLRSSVMVKDN